MLQDWMPCWPPAGPALAQLVSLLVTPDGTLLAALLLASTLVYALATLAVRRGRALACRRSHSLQALQQQQDGLLQGGQGLMLSLYATAMGQPEGSAIRRELEQLLDAGDRWLAHSRLALQQQAMLGDGRLEQQLLALAQQLPLATAATYSLCVLGRPQVLPSAVRQALLQLTLQTLLSAVRPLRHIQLQLCFAGNCLGLHLRCHDSATKTALATEFKAWAELLPPGYRATLQLVRGPAAQLELLLQCQLNPAAAVSGLARWQRYGRWLRCQLYWF